MVRPDDAHVASPAELKERLAAEPADQGSETVTRLEPGTDGS